MHAVLSLIFIRFHFILPSVISHLNRFSARSLRGGQVGCDLFTCILSQVERYSFSFVSDTQQSSSLIRMADLSRSERAEWKQLLQQAEELARHPSIALSKDQVLLQK